MQCATQRPDVPNSVLWIVSNYCSQRMAVRSYTGGKRPQTGQKHRSPLSPVAHLVQLMRVDDGARFVDSLLLLNGLWRARRAGRRWLLGDHFEDVVVDVHAGSVVDRAPRRRPVEERTDVRECFEVDKIRLKQRRVGGVVHARCPC